jgi:RNA polymerase sigma-70 factor (ECF subfamily)
MTALEKSSGKKLRRFLAVRMRLTADVPDLMQEVFLRLLRIKNYEEVRNPQAYLYTVASHVLQQYMLERAGEPECMDPFDMADRLESATATDPAETVEHRQLIERFGRALEQLSPRSYTTLILYRCDGLSLDEIAKRMGVSRPMVRKYLTRAIAFCDRHLEELE